jgi:hypothetical protein
VLEIAGKILLNIDKISNPKVATMFFQKSKKKFNNNFKIIFLVMRAFSSQPDFYLFFPENII